MKNSLYRSLLQRLAPMAFALLCLCAFASAAVAQTTATALADKTATVYGVKIHYQEAGSGPVLVLLHGLGADGSSWAANIVPLAAKYRVIVPDQIGFGKSDKPFISYRVGTLVDFLNGLLKELKIERASLVGNSLGGFTAAAYALAYPDKVDKLVLVDAAGYAVPKETDPRTFQVLNPSTRQGVKQVMSLIFYDQQRFANEAVIDAIFTKKMMAGDGYTVQQFIESILRGEDVLDGKLDKIKQPTLLVWGREDLLTPLAMGERFNQDIKGSHLFILDKCGHVPQMEKAAEFNANVLKFLAGESLTATGGKP
ncbi:MAG: alpha/beta hydrolase [Acidobacteria bacterium]|nr:alpha/beta hydrolase [Acidobacteriota bacterium]